MSDKNFFGKFYQKKFKKIKFSWSKNNFLQIFLKEKYLIKNKFETTNFNFRLFFLDQRRKKINF